MDDTNRFRTIGLEKVKALQEEGVNPFANHFKPENTCQELLKKAEESSLPSMGEVADDAPRYSIAGRIMTKNNMGKSIFMRLRDRSIGIQENGPQNFQIYARKGVIDEAQFELVKSKLDLGDIVGVSGRLFVTNTGEATLLLDSLVLLTKSILPLPDKFHGLQDQETRFRQRYLDLMTNPKVQHIFRARTLITNYVRQFLTERDYIEVETPMMHTIPGGASARPFVTHHNALNIPLYLRIAPELYLKRLLVGGLERVFEINRNFRNEGLSVRHNPEFTMVEFYEAYATFEDLIALTEALLEGIARSLAEDEGQPGQLIRPFGPHQINWEGPYARYTVKESLGVFAGLSESELENKESLLLALRAKGLELSDKLSYGMLLIEGFEGLVEKNIVQPTFITHYPVENSPLARRNEANPAVTDRFEIFVAGHELGNAFSELNDPIDQHQRFLAQVEARKDGDDEAMHMDHDYVRALEYGMPPAAGEGIGIDRLVMFMTNQTSIREVILFPHMRPV